MNLLVISSQLLATVFLLGSFLASSTIAVEMTSEEIVDICSSDKSEAIRLDIQAEHTFENNQYFYVGELRDNQAFPKLYIFNIEEEDCQSFDLHDYTYDVPISMLEFISEDIAIELRFNSISRAAELMGGAEQFKQQFLSEVASGPSIPSSTIYTIYPIELIRAFEKFSITVPPPYTTVNGDSDRTKAIGALIREKETLRGFNYLENIILKDNYALATYHYFDEVGYVLGKKDESGKWDQLATFQLIDSPESLVENYFIPYDTAIFLYEKGLQD